MRDRAPRSYYLLALNWLLFFSVSLWISVAQGNLLWWLRLRWGSWLTELSGIGQLNALPAGSIWILWLIVSLILTAIDWFLPWPKEALEDVANKFKKTTHHKVRLSCRMPTSLTLGQNLKKNFFDCNSHWNESNSADAVVCSL